MFASPKSHLEALANYGNLITGANISADYGHDELPGLAAMPECVIDVSSTKEVSDVMRFCNEHAIPVTVRGAGTGKMGGSVPVCGGVVLSLKGMNAILGIDPDAKTITVQPGVLLQDVKAEAARVSLCYPVDPGEKTATIGGNVSTNAGGPSTIKYGNTGANVLDAVIVLPGGAVARLSDNEKYVSVIGSEGTLAVITEITLKLTKKPASEVILLLPFLDVESCINAAVKLKSADFSPATLEYLDTDTVEFSGKVTGNPVFPVKIDGERIGATLMLTLEADGDDELDELLEAVAELAEELECLDILVVDTSSLKRDVWDAHNAFHSSTESAGCVGELNIDIPCEHYYELIQTAKALGGSKGLTVLPYGHVGSGGLHIHVVADMNKADFGPLMDKFRTAVYEKCIELGGDISGEYGIGYAKKAFISNETKLEFKSLKDWFDPKGILNPGKVAD